MLYSLFVSRVPPLRPIKFLEQWIILVLPFLLSMTVFANTPAFLSFSLILLAYIVSFFPCQCVGTSLPSQSPMLSGPSSPQISPLPAVTVYRAHMMLMTILGILAVDFPVFPRALAKCETFGVSLVYTLLLHFAKCILTGLSIQDGSWCWFFCVFARTCFCSSFA